MRVFVQCIGVACGHKRQLSKGEMFRGQNDPDWAPLCDKLVPVLWPNSFEGEPKESPELLPCGLPCEIYKVTDDEGQPMMKNPPQPLKREP